MNHNLVHDVMRLARNRHAVAQDLAAVEESMAEGECVVSGGERGGVVGASGDDPHRRRILSVTFTALPSALSTLESTSCAVGSGR